MTSRPGRRANAIAWCALSKRRAPRVEVNLVVPKNFNDAQQIADKFKIDSR